MKHVAQKLLDSGNENVMLTDRGTMFGYGDLIIDYRGIPEMKKFGHPVVLDITHSLQQPNQDSGVTGGRPDMIETVARAGIVVGADGLFIETHPNPSQAKSDGANMLNLKLLKRLLENLTKIRYTVNNL
jgi:2-dehydro-3-deoxyphosphooctonate aldolase (KDO 8-P synthase)